MVKYFAELEPMLRDHAAFTIISACVHQATFVSFLHAFITQTCAGTKCHNMPSYEYIFKMNINNLENGPYTIW